MTNPSIPILAAADSLKERAVVLPRGQLQKALSTLASQMELFAMRGDPASGEKIESIASVARGIVDAAETDEDIETAIDCLLDLARSIRRVRKGESDE